MQRRHQKVSKKHVPHYPGISSLHRRTPAKALISAIAVAEFLFENGESIHRNNTFRIQVEIPVTEMIGVDLIKEQLRIAAGQPPSIASTVHVRAMRGMRRTSTPKIRTPSCQVQNHPFHAPGGFGVRWGVLTSTRATIYRHTMTPMIGVDLLATVKRWGDWVREECG